MVQVMLSTESYDLLLSKELLKRKNISQISDPVNVSQNKTKNTKNEYKWEIIWSNVASLFVLHSLLLYFIYLLVTLRVKFATFMFGYVSSILPGFGITAGAHRLWAHRSYKANLPLRIFLMIAQSSALQTPIHEWVRDHRTHHKFNDTDADPHNAQRGFFFAHVGWLMCRKHEDVSTKGKRVDMSDIFEDPVVQFQMRYHIPLALTLTFLIPSLIPWYFWGENGWISFITCTARYTCLLNGTWLVNSAAHMYGMRPYDSNIKPAENKFVAFLALGEGWHNYHHVFPWDYKTAELGNYRLNFTTCFLDFMAKIGWATDLKTASEEMIKNRVNRTGANSKRNGQNIIEERQEEIWGWNDSTMDPKERKFVTRIN